MRCRATSLAIVNQTGGGYVATDADARAYIAAVEVADGQPLELPVKQAMDALFAGIKADNSGSLSAFGQIILLAGPRTVNGCVCAFGTAPLNSGFVSGDLTRQTGLLSDGLKRLVLNRNGQSDAQNSRHLYARTTSAGTQDVIRWLIGTASVASGHTAIGTTTTVRRYAGASSTAINVSGNILSGGHGVARQNASDLVRLEAGVSTTAANASAAPTVNGYDLFGTGSNGLNCRVAVVTSGAFVDLTALDARVTTYLNALAAAGI